MTNYTPLPTEIEAEGLFNVFFSSPELYSIAIVALAAPLLFVLVLKLLNKGNFKENLKFGIFTGVMLCIASLYPLSLLTFKESTEPTRQQNELIYNTAFDNIQKKYKIDELIEFRKDTKNKNHTVFQGEYYDFKQNNISNLKFAFKPTGEPILMGNEVVTQQYIKSLEKNPKELLSEWEKEQLNNQLMEVFPDPPSIID